MTDYISREAAIAYIRAQAEESRKAFAELGGESGIYAEAYDCLADEFRRLPAAHVEPMLNGNYKRLGTFTVLAEVRQCFVCRCNYLAETTFKRCPICGVYTDLEV